MPILPDAATTPVERRELQFLRTTFFPGLDMKAQRNSVPTDTQRINTKCLDEPADVEL